MRARPASDSLIVGHGEEVGGARQQEAARHGVHVDDLLDGADQAVAAELDLVHHQRMGLVEQESPRVGHRGIEGGVVVERGVGAAAPRGHQAAQSRLAALPGPVEDHDPEAVQGLLDQRQHLTGDDLHRGTLAPNPSSSGPLILIFKNG